MSKKNKFALIFIFTGLLSGILLSLMLPEEKLVISISLPSALIGGGLSQWSSTQKENEDEDE
ncbi:MAG: hypothetical protein GPJ00_08765 [Microcystis aeruginosa W13-18]|jgi:hypothetical protein|nr:hypothetical protein [Microcystis aeruginosa W13-18]NCR37799.1 hypothetical protein [Microcystis aeruginosa S11-05]NCR51300.1 hypothetical protein [Microcystis aeruginosa S11-01]